MQNSDKGKVVHIWKNLWPEQYSMMIINEVVKLKGTVCQVKNKMKSDLFTSESFNELEEVDIEEDFTINNEFPVVHSLSDGKINKIVLN